jgi:hypothetical protein
MGSYEATGNPNLKLDEITSPYVRFVPFDTSYSSWTANVHVLELATGASGEVTSAAVNVELSGRTGEDGAPPWPAHHVKMRFNSTTP